MSLRMQGVDTDGRPFDGPHHGADHEWDTECDAAPACKPINEITNKNGDPRADWQIPTANTRTIICDTTPGYDPPPEHYDRGIDPWAVWDAFDLDRYTANAVKYLLRAGKKDIAPRLDDLKKAANYIAKAIEMEQKNG